MSSYSRPSSSLDSWPDIITRAPLPVFPPPVLQSQPELPSPPRQPAFDAPYSLTTHLFPAAYLRTSRLVPVPPPPPDTLTKAERQEFLSGTRQDLADLRVTVTPQGVPQVLWNCANRYIRKGSTGKGVTLFFAHANGFPKEVRITVYLS